MARKAKECNNSFMRLGALSQLSLSNLPSSARPPFLSLHDEYLQFE